MRRLAAGALVLLLSGCGGEAFSPPSAPKPRPAPADIPKIPHSFNFEQTTRRRVDGLKVRVFNTGSVSTRGRFVSSMKALSAKVTLDVPVFLIKHPTQGYVLFDTGLNPDASVNAKRQTWLGRMFAPFVSQPGQDAVSQLEAAGVSAQQVNWVVISHLHPDHAGMIDAFPNATVIVDKREWQAQKDRQAKKKDPTQFDPADYEGKIHVQLVDLSSAPAYGAFDHGLDLFKDGTMFLLDLSGHTPGNLGLWVSLDDSPMLLAGDASWILDNHQDLALPIKTSIYDIDAYWRRLYQMRDMQEALPRLVIFPGHDLLPLKLQPRPDIEEVKFSPAPARR